MRCSARARTASPPTRPTSRSRWSRSMRPSRCAAPGGQRTVPLIDFHRLPGDTPHIETVLEPGEVIAAITVPASPVARRSHYLKVRDRASFEFAVVSAAVALDMDGGRIRQARVALGGVGTKPWRVPQGRGGPGRREPRSGGAPPGGGARRRRRAGARAQRLQDRTHAARHRARRRNRGSPRMTTAVHRTTRQPRRRPPEGHGRAPPTPPSST